MNPEMLDKQRARCVLMIKYNLGQVVARLGSHRNIKSVQVLGGHGFLHKLRKMGQTKSKLKRLGDRLIQLHFCWAIIKT